MLERIECVAGGWSQTFVLAQRESHWCLTTQTCLLLIYSSTVLLFYSFTLLPFYPSILSTYEYSSNLSEFALNPRVNPRVNPGLNPRVNPRLNPRPLFRSLFRSIFRALFRFSLGFATKCSKRTLLHLEFE